MKNLRIFFSDWYTSEFLPGNTVDNLYSYLLSKNYNVIIDAINPDVIFYDLPPTINSDIKNKNCLKIFCTNEPSLYAPSDIVYHRKGERFYESINNADYILTSYKIDSPKNYYVPTFLFWLYHHVFVSKIVDSFEYFTQSKKYTKTDIENRKFCMFLHNNRSPFRREQIRSKLNAYNPVHSKENFSVLPGSVNKINFLKNYKFSFAMQNHSTIELIEGQNYYPGFICEKIIESYFGNTVPLYYGNDKITDYFNKDSFLNWHDFVSDESFIEKIIELDNNDDLYLEYLNQPTFLNLDVLKLDEIAEFLKKIIG